MSIAQAARAAKVYYPTAKAINRIYQQTGRTDKKAHRAPRVPKNNTTIQKPPKCKGKSEEGKQCRAGKARLCGSKALKDTLESTRSKERSTKKNFKST